MKRSLCRNCILTAATLILPGCLAINAVLGVVGFMSTGPIQYAGAVYSVGEYTYEYAVNDKTPDEVIETKLAWLLLDDQTSIPIEPELTGYARAMENTKISESTRELLQDTFKPKKAKPRIMVASSHQRSLPLPPAIMISAQSVRPSPSAPTTNQTIHKTPARPQRGAAQPNRAVLPVHTYIERTPDPLQQKLARLGQTLRQAEQVAAREPDSGVRFSVSNEEAGQPATGINGSWSIRHSIMQYAPAPKPLSEPLVSSLQNSPT